MRVEGLDMGMATLMALMALMAVVRERLSHALGICPQFESCRQSVACRSGQGIYQCHVGGFDTEVQATAWHTIMIAVLVVVIGNRIWIRGLSEKTNHPEYSRTSPYVTRHR